MNTHYSTFDPQEVILFEEAKSLSRTNYNLNPVNNIYIILDKINQYKDTNAVYVECGTFKGNTLLTAANYCKLKGIDKRLIGVDTFKGFPNTEHYYKDLPEYFNELYNTGKISQYHYNKAKDRTENFTNLSHLEHEYFSDIKDIFEQVKDFNNVELAVGTFQEVLPTMEEDIAVLHLDGDLYHSYMTCLVNLFVNVISGGCIIFDEYYSYKYPGARAAVDEFFQDKLGFFEMFVTPEGFERWCFVKD